MKYAGKVLIVLLLAVLILVPFQAAQARGLLNGQVIFGSNYTLKSGETLDGDLVVFGGTVTVEKGARVNGSVVLMGGSVSIDGEVSKDVVVIGGAVKLGENTHVYGSLVTIGAPVDRNAQAKVDGDVIDNPPYTSIPLPDTSQIPQTQPGSVNIPGSGLVWNLFSLFGQSLVLAALAVLIVLFIPEQTRRVGESAVKQPFMAGSMGLLSILLFVVSIVALALFSLLIITLIVTIPMIFILSVALAAGAVFGLISLGLELGLRLAAMVNSTWALPLAAGLGTFLLNLVVNSIGFIPCIGWLMPTLVGLVGLGAVVLTRFGMRPAYLAATPALVESVPPVENV
jgi:hypothetical protein